MNARGGKQGGHNGPSGWTGWKERFGRLPVPVLPRISLPGWFGRGRRLLLGIGIALGLFLLSNLLDVYVEYLWFSDLGYIERYLNVLIPRLVIFIVSFLCAVFVPLLNARFITRDIHAGPLFNRIVLAASLLFATIFAAAMSGRVYEYLLFLNKVPFDHAEPIFGMDIGFYIFILPVLKTVKSALFWLVLFALAGTALVRLAFAFGEERMDSFFPGRAAFGAVGPEYKNRTITHLSALGIAMIAVFMFWTQIAKWDLMYSPRGAVFGPGWTDVHVQIMAYNVFIGALAVSAVLLGVSVFARDLKRTAGAAVLGLAICAITWVVGIWIVPVIVQKYKVTPNELSMEREYIMHNIKLTKIAYGLTDDRIRQIDFPVNFSGITSDIVSKNRVTFDNVRLWDWRVLQSNNNQYQGFRLYYVFPDISVVRYTINGKVQQMMYSARELDVSRLAEQSRTWQNRHFVYTHGFGAVANPVNRILPEGSPDYWVKDIPPVSKYPELGIKQPRIYFGDATHQHVYVRTAHEEFDYPVGDTNATYRYEADSGIRLDSLLKRLAFAVKLDGIRLLTSAEITSETRLLWRRDIATRVKTLAPFLSFDSDRYQVVAAGGLYEIWDAYTTSRDFPYSEPHRGRHSLNYIRNSVKVVINSYTGKVDFYIFDDEDPIIKTYQKIFPGMFKPASQMPGDLRAHVRYPEDLLRIQGDIYSMYHMSDPGVFYNREDAWQPAGELHNGRVEPMMPYYLVMTLPGEKKEEFVLIRPFTPLTTSEKSPRNNMVSWIAARCDGDNYGKLLLFKFPKDRLVYGPLQISARINQDEVISKDITLWNQQGSQVVFGNLIIMPLSDYRLLYVQPIYMQAAVSKMPELKRVVVSLGERIGYGTSFDDALAKLMARDAAAAPQEFAQVAKPDLLRRAVKALEEYQTLQGTGRFGEAGKKLEELKELLRRLSAN